MFGSKKPAKKPLWSIRVLTRDTLIDGFIDSDSSDMILTNDGTFENIQLTSAQIQTTSNLITPNHPTTPWATVFREAVVAVIPGDEASLTYALETNDFEDPILAEVYAGPYLIRGLVMAEVEKLDIYTDTEMVIVKDAQIDCLLPGAKLKGLHAQVVFLTSAHIQVLHPV
jgi:hypothetical protein